jgi:hypothetical protein
LVGNTKELTKDSVFAKEVNQPASPINYVMMVTESVDGVKGDELALTEAELFIKRLFVQGDYKNYADKFQISRDDLRKILFEASAFLNKKKVACIIALVMKKVEESREVLITRMGTGSSFIINTQEVRLLNEEKIAGKISSDISEDDSAIIPQLFSGKLKKDDILLLSSESLSSGLELNQIKSIVSSSKAPEEACKKLLHSSSQIGGKENISVAIFNGAAANRIPVKKRISFRTLLFILIPPFIILLGVMIYNISSGNKTKNIDKPPVDTFESLHLTPIVPKDTLAQVNNENIPIDKKKDIVEAPEKNIKKNKKALTVEVKEKVREKEVPDNTTTYKNVNFLVNGSVVLISNWESVGKGVKRINWFDGKADKKRIHKYTDYTSIPSSVTITFKDNTTKSYKIK